MEPAAPSWRTGGYLRVVAGLTSANAVAVAAGLVTGPIVARALGTDGRGELAAIVVVIAVLPAVLDLGLPSWLARERARGARRSDLLGAILPLVLVASLVGILIAGPLSAVLGNGRPVVERYVEIALLLSPLVIIPATLIGLAIGDSRWGMVSATRIIAAVVPLLAIVLLAILGQLTVGSAAGSYLAATVLASAVLLVLARGSGRPALSVRRSREALRFGAQSWLVAIAAVASARLDQLLMIALVSSTQLGLYAVAVTVTTSLIAGLIAAVCHAVFPRVAAGDHRLAARSLRVSLCVAVLIAAAAAAAAPFAVPFVFGAPFADAVPMVLILLAAALPLAAAVMLGSALTAAGAPATALRAQLVGLVVMVPALIVLLPSTGGQGAAVISLVAYSVQLADQLRSVRHTFGLPWHEFLLPRREDVIWIRTAIAERNGSVVS